MTDVEHRYTPLQQEENNRSKTKSIGIYKPKSKRNWAEKQSMRCFVEATETNDEFDLNPERLT